MSKVTDKALRIFARDFTELQFLQSSKKPLDRFIGNTMRRLEKTVITELQEARPNFGVLSHFVNIESKCNDRWIINFLDGEVNFSHALPFFTFSIAVEAENEKGEKEVISSIILEPAANTTYYAEKGKGAWAEYNGQRMQRIRVSPRNVAQYSLIATNDDAGQIGSIRHNIRRICCDSLSLVYLASGKVEKCILLDSDYINIAASFLMLSESGGVIDELSRDKNMIKKLSASNGCKF